MKPPWSPERLKQAKIGVRIAAYKAIPATPYEAAMEEINPQMFNFDAISVGDDNGQAFIVPLDESSRDVAEYIIRAIAAYKGE